MLISLIFKQNLLKFFEEFQKRIELNKEKRMSKIRVWREEDKMSFTLYDSKNKALKGCRGDIDNDIS